MASSGPSAIRPNADYRFPGPGERELVYAGSTFWNGTGEPWWALGEITTRALAPHGYEVKILPQPAGWENPRFVADGRADIGSTNPNILYGAFHASGACEGEDARDSLRSILTVCRPSWAAVAVTQQSGITDLGQIKERRQAIRMIAGAGADELFAHYGFTREDVVSYGGEDVDGHAERGGRNVDLIIGNLYACNSPAAYRWLDACVTNEVRFLDLPDAFIEQQVAAGDGEPGFIPHGYLPGVDHDVRTVAHPYLAIYSRADAPEDFVRTLAQACDENRDYFRQTHVNFSYDPNHVARHARIPLHEAALAYYEERGYLVE